MQDGEITAASHGAAGAGAGPASRLPPAARQVRRPLVPLADSQLMEGVLSQIGYRTRTAHDGQSVLREAGEHRPDLMLLDVSLPDVSGIEICRNLRTEPG